VDAAADSWVLPGARGALSPPLVRKRKSYVRPLSSSCSSASSSPCASPRSRVGGAGRDCDPLLVGLRRHFPDLERETLLAGLNACEGSMPLCVWYFRSKGWGASKKASRKSVCMFGELPMG
jgi:hypothetical protein